MHTLQSKVCSPFGPPLLYNIAIGCMLGDACMYRVSKDAKIKFEQGYMHKDGTVFIIYLIYSKIILSMMNLILDMIKVGLERV